MMDVDLLRAYDAAEKEVIRTVLDEAACLVEDGEDMTVADMLITGAEIECDTAGLRAPDAPERVIRRASYLIACAGGLRPDDHHDPRIPQAVDGLSRQPAHVRHQVLRRAASGL